MWNCPFCYKQVDDRFFWNKHMIEDLISIDVSLASNNNVLWELFFSFSWNVYLRPCRSLLKNLLGRWVRIRAVPSEAEQLALPSSPSQPSGSLLVSLWSLLMNEHQQNLKFYYNKAMQNNATWYVCADFKGKLKMYSSVKWIIPGQSWTW